MGFGGGYDCPLLSSAQASMGAASWFGFPLYAAHLRDASAYSCTCDGAWSQTGPQCDPSFSEDVFHQCSSFTTIKATAGTNGSGNHLSQKEANFTLGTWPSQVPGHLPAALGCIGLWAQQLPPILVATWGCDLVLPGNIVLGCHRGERTMELFQNSSYLHWLRDAPTGTFVLDKTI